MGHRQHSVVDCDRPLLEHDQLKFLDWCLWIRFRFPGENVGHAEFLLSLRVGPCMETLHGLLPAVHTNGHGCVASTGSRDGKLFFRACITCIGRHMRAWIEFSNRRPRRQSVASVYSAVGTWARELVVFLWFSYGFPDQGRTQ